MNNLENFDVANERFDDVQVLRYRVPGFENLSSQQKELAYYLYEAALCGRDIIYDQNYKYNLRIRKALENIYETYAGDRNTEEFERFIVYLKKVWFANGIHHRQSKIKFIPEFSFEYFQKLVENSDAGKFPLDKNQTVGGLLGFLKPIMFDPTVDPKTVDLSADADNVVASANNYYEDVTHKEVDEYYRSIKEETKEPVSYGLNSKMMKEGEVIVEKVWKIGGMYGSAIEKIVAWLERAVAVAEDERQKESLGKLIKYFKSGNLKDFDEYSVAWVADTDAIIDTINGFIEVYNDAIGKRGAYESVVSIKDLEETKKIQAISAQAQWFEDNLPINPDFKKETTKGISVKAITVVVEAGDMAPSGSTIGVNLPNAEWIRETHGSKSATLKNINEAFVEFALSSPSFGEFTYSQEEIERARKYFSLSGDLHTILHEVIGHASGKSRDSGEPRDVALKNYYMTLEEARADLVALYYIMDEKLVELGIMPSLEVGKAEYDSFIRGGLITQLISLNLGENLEEAHMRNRQLAAAWVFEKGKADNVIEKIKKDGKTYVKVNDYEKLRKLFGELLREIQRIKSEGDYEAGKNLVETYGVKVDQELLREVKERFAKLNMATYKCFIQPKLTPIFDGEKIKDIQLGYPDNFAEQMMFYSKNYNFLPWNN